MIGWYQFKRLIEHATGISMDALHILVGFSLFVVAAVLLRRGLASWLPWAALLFLELVNEAYDLHIERWPDLASQLGESLKDILLTMAVPTAILLLARFRPHWLSGSQAPRKG